MRRASPGEERRRPALSPCSICKQKHRCTAMCLKRFRAYSLVLSDNGVGCGTTVKVAHFPSDRSRMPKAPFRRREGRALGAERTGEIRVGKRVLRTVLDEIVRSETVA